MEPHTLVTVRVLDHICVSPNFLVIEQKLHEQHALNYDRLGRWLLVAAIITGAAIRVSSKVGELLVLML
ncbi:MAG: hypothetical protein SFT94_03215 [Pseudanabaenaceae cyanobacterium bins.68]|nr:hypothetical protein [Pseudanabaenaceae cyanobacterium bins.68]